MQSTYIYIYHTKLLKKLKQSFKIEIESFFPKFSLLTPFEYTKVITHLCISKGENCALLINYILKHDSLPFLIPHIRNIYKSYDGI